MVDSINPIDQNNSLGATTSPGMTANNFYAGFNRPQDVKVNLADTTDPGSASVSEPAAGMDSISSNQPQAPSFTSFQNQQTSPSFTAPTQSHVSYEGGSDNRLTIIGIVGGFIFLILVSVVTYFASSGINSTKLNAEKNDLQSLKNELQTAKNTPSALELPQAASAPESTSTDTTNQVQTPPQTQADTTTTTQTPVVTTPVQQPVETPAPTVPPASQGGNG